MQKFKELGLSAELVKALTESGITDPTTIQEQAIPTLLQGDTDFIGLAQTGTGKTAAFGLPLLELINEESRVTQSLIIAPTRELAVQTAENLKQFARYRKRVVIDVVYGGTPITPHIRQLKQQVPMILVATPGRLIDLVDRKAIHLDKVSYVVLDEADEILNMGFKEDLDKILSFTPAEKNTWLFSATMPPGIRRIVKNYMHDPAEVTVSKQERVNKNISHQYVLVQRKDRVEALKRLIDAAPEFYGLVFCRTKIDAQQLAEHLMGETYHAGALHGDLSQRQRNDTMKRFKSKMLKVLVATDVAARGIDVDDLTHVIHYALPDDPSFYTHRSGRTARAGKKGKSIILLTPDSERKLKALRHDLGIEISRVEVPTHDQIWKSKLDNWAQRILDSNVSEVPEELLNHAMERFADIDKKEILARLLALEIAQLKPSTGDLNVKDRSGADKSRGSDRNSRGNDRSREKKNGKTYDGPSATGELHRFFINLGSFDQLNRGSMLKLICDKTNLSKRNIGNIDIGKKHSYFEIDKKSSSQVTSAFRDFSYKGRKIRVNRDASK